MPSFLSLFRRADVDRIAAITIPRVEQPPPIAPSALLLWRVAFAVSTFLLAMSSATAQIPGTLDTTFGSGTGKVILPIGPGLDQATASAIQPDRNRVGRNA